MAEAELSAAAVCAAVSQQLSALGFARVWFSLTLHRGTETNGNMPKMVAMVLV
jgi:hypothetical protein